MHDPARADDVHPHVRRRTLRLAVRRALLVVLVASIALITLARPGVAAEARATEAFRRSLWNDFDAAAHWDEVVREVVWGWSPHSDADGWFEAVRRALWRDQDGRAHWDEALRRYFWDQQYPPPDSMLAAASAYQYRPDPGVWSISSTPCGAVCDGVSGTVLGVTFDGTAVVLFPEAFDHGQAIVNYVVAHESGHMWANDHKNDVTFLAVMAKIDTYPAADPPKYDASPDYEKYADCYAQKQKLTRPLRVGYWDCPADVLALPFT